MESDEHLGRRLLNARINNKFECVRRERENEWHGGHYNTLRSAAASRPSIPRLRLLIVGKNIKVALCLMCGRHTTFMRVMHYIIITIIAGSRRCGEKLISQRAR